jgi:hypothetical protein
MLRHRDPDRRPLLLCYIARDFGTWVANFLIPLVLQGGSQAMQHEPIRLSSYSESAAHSVRTDSVFAVDQYPKSELAIVETERGILACSSCGSALLALSPTGEQTPEAISRRLLREMVP